jgi:hypothetical protein
VATVVWASDAGARPPNVFELTTKLRIEVEPHGVDPAVLGETTQYHRNRALEDRWWTWTIW